MADLKLTDVEKTYGGSVNVLNNINLDIKTGELIVLWVHLAVANPLCCA